VVNSPLKQKISDVFDLNSEVQALPESVVQPMLRLANSFALEQSGSLLKTVLSVASLHDQVLGLYLGGASTNDVKLFLDTDAEIQSKRPKSVKAVWYSVCKSIADAAKMAAADALYRTLPKTIREANIQSGQSDVMDLPLELFTIAHNVLLDAQKGGMKHAGDMATNVVMTALALFGYDPSPETLDVKLLLGWKTFATELTGSAALYVLGVCPAGNHPKDVLNRRLGAWD